MKGLVVLSRNYKVLVGDEMTKQSLLQTQSTSWSGKCYVLIKRLFDCSFAMLCLIGCSPLFCFVALLLKLNDRKNTVFFKQQRIGLNGNKFFIYKFRTLVYDAEQRLLANPALYEKYVANDFKLAPEDDPRMTKIGRLLRKTSLDELPQLWNILKGDMSFVGPRPVIEEELEHYKAQKAAFLSVKPGVTGYWQVNGRSEVSYPERTQLELHYVYNRSLLLDLIILWKTVPVVFSKKGAY